MKSRILPTLFMCLFYLSGHSAPLVSNSKISATGVILPAHQVVLSAKIMGRVNKIAVEEANVVKKGTVLLTLEDAEPRADLSSAKASVALAKEELKHAQRVEERMKRLAKSQSVSQDRIDDAVFQSAAAKERVKVAEANVAKVQAMLKQSSIKAPFDGVITEKKVELGHLTQPGEALFVLEDHSQLKFRMKVKEKDIPYIKLEQPLTITIDALQGLKLEAKVSKLIPSGDPATHAFVVEALLEPADNLYPGMFGKAEFK